MVKTSFLFICISVLIHVFFIRTIHNSVPMIDLRPKSNNIEVEIIDSSETKKTKTTSEDKQQIVEQDERPINDETPKDAKYLSRNDQRVVRETRASKSGQFNNSAGHNGDSTEGQKKQEEKQTQLSDKGSSIKNFLPKFNYHKKNNAKSGRESATDDYLKDLPMGVETLLSTKEFVYYSYYSRIKSRIRMHWSTKIREKVTKLIKGGRYLATSKDRITRLVIILDAKGTLIKIQLRGKSGVSDLDDAAIEAFKAAAPFPNPPKGMVEKDGTIKINWDFILEARTRKFDKRKMAQAL